MPDHQKPQPKSQGATSLNIIHFLTPNNIIMSHSNAAQHTAV